MVHPDPSGHVGPPPRKAVTFRVAAFLFYPRFTPKKGIYFNKILLIKKRECSL